MNGTAYGPDLTLTPHQEDLLRTALSSNNPIESSSQISRNGTSGTTRSNSDPKQLQRTNDHMANGPNMFTSPLQETPGSGQLGSFDESPFLDYELDDGNFDWDNSTDQLFGDLPGTESHVDGEHHDKRKASMDDEDDEEGTSKRREGDDKSAKKPGRKPLTGEPTTVCSFRLCAPTPLLTFCLAETQGAKQSCPKSFPRAQRTSPEGFGDQSRRPRESFRGYKS